MMRWLMIWSVCLPLPVAALAQVIPADTTQCLLGIAEDWDSSKVTLTWHQRTKGEWKQVGEAWPARLGKKGMAWGLGLHPVPEEAVMKREGDWKSPAGVFALGGVWGYEPSVERQRGWPYTRITPRHLWVEDPESEHYNRQIILDREPRGEWEKKQQMKQGDHAHSLKLFIAHNAPPRVVKGAGSSIFFHIWRDQGGRPSAGCTTMAELQLRGLIAQLDPKAKPVYVLLPQVEYAKHRNAWNLP